MTDKILGTYTRHESPDYMDGGVTAAAFEKEAEEPTAEVRELRSALAREIARGNALQDALDAAESRPLTPDAITDEMVERGRSAYWGPTYGLNAEERVRAILTAALTEPPARPEWADAPAVLAHRESEQDAPTRVWANVGEDVWASDTHRAHTRFLRGVTPLYPEGVRVVGEGDPQ